MRRAKQELPVIFKHLKSLLDQLDKTPPKPARRGPGRPTKNQADTVPVILHLYKSQVQWLDEYAQMIAGIRPENARLSRAEIVRGLLLGLGRYAMEHNMPFPEEMPVKSERDLQYAIAEALHRD